MISNLRCDEKFGTKYEDWIEAPNDYFNHWHVCPELLKGFICGNIHMKPHHLMEVRKLLTGAYLYDYDHNIRRDDCYTTIEQIMIVFFYPVMNFESDIKKQLMDGFENAVRIFLMEQSMNRIPDTGVELDDSDTDTVGDEYLDSDSFEINVTKELQFHYEDFLNL